MTLLKIINHCSVSKCMLSCLCLWDCRNTLKAWYPYCRMWKMSSAIFTHFWWYGTIHYMLAFKNAGVLSNTISRCLHNHSLAPVPTLPPLTSTWPHLRCDVGLEEGVYRENCLCLAVLCTIIMVHKDTSSSYRSVDCIGLWSCLV